MDNGWIAISLFKKTLLIISLTLIGLTGILFITGQLIILQKFVQIEEDIMNTNMERVRNAIDTEKNDLANFTRDWAHWDDTYQFIEDSNEEYKEANLTLETQALNRMDIILYLDKYGGILY